MQAFRERLVLKRLPYVVNTSDANELPEEERPLQGHESDELYSSRVNALGYMLEQTKDERNTQEIKTINTAIMKRCREILGDPRRNHQSSLIRLQYEIDKDLGDADSSICFSTDSQSLASKYSKTLSRLSSPKDGATRKRTNLKSAASIAAFIPRWAGKYTRSVFEVLSRKPEEPGQLQMCPNFRYSLSAAASEPAIRLEDHAVRSATQSGELSTKAMRRTFVRRRKNRGGCIGLFSSTGMATKDLSKPFYYIPLNVLPQTPSTSAGEMSCKVAPTKSWACGKPRPHTRLAANKKCP